MATLRCAFPSDGHSTGDYRNDVSEEEAARLTQVDPLTRIQKWVRAKSVAREELVLSVEPVEIVSERSVAVKSKPGKGKKPGSKA